jgi:hypothetical protein
MTIRRRLHAFAGSGNEEQYFQTGFFRATPTTVRLDQMMHTPEPHPALTDFGPDTLTAFVRDQIRNNEAVSNGEAQAPETEAQKNEFSDTELPTSSPGRAAPQSVPATGRRSIHDEVAEMQARYMQAQEYSQPVTLSLVPGALRHLHGLSDASSTSGTRPRAGLSNGSPSRKTKTSPRKRNSSDRNLYSEDEFDIDFDEAIAASPRRQVRMQLQRVQTGSPSRRLRYSPRRHPTDWRQIPMTSGVTYTVDGSEGSYTAMPVSPGYASTSDGLQHISVVRPSLSVDVTAMTPYDYHAVLPTATPTVPVPVSRPAVRAGRFFGRNSTYGRALRRKTLTLPTIIDKSPRRGAAPDGDPSDGDDDSDGDDLDALDNTPFPDPNDSADKVFRGTGPTPGPKAPPSCPLPTNPDYRMKPLPVDIWIAVAEYLSVKDIHSLRLTNRAIMALISPLLFRSMVAPLDLDMPILFGTNQQSSILSKWGGSIHRFAISFEYDPMELAFARPKQNMQTQHAWYGEFEWPTSQYPRDDKLKKLEDLVSDNNPLLPILFSRLPEMYELALSVDNGHGWLEGPDISDMALFDRRQKKGSRVLGQEFDNEHRWDAYSRDEYFKWAQRNAINRTLISLANAGGAADAVNVLTNLTIRERESFKLVASQPDFDPHSHTGGQSGSVTAFQNANLPPAPPMPPAQATGLAAGLATGLHAGFGPYGGAPAGQWAALLTRARTSTALPTLNGDPISRSHAMPSGPAKKQRPVRKVPLQWPLIFNGINIAAETGGLRSAVRSIPADPQKHPLQPGSLTEAQAQWLMEQWWAQEHFLITYTSSIIANEQRLNVRVLNIAKISSGLLSTLAQPKFWAALPKLQHLKILVSPDWRSDHRPQSLFVQRSLLISPLNAVGKFASFLQDFVCNNEKLLSATFGWVGGGEHGVGICARNQHLLPAPIIFNCEHWITGQNQPMPLDADNMVKFDHVRELTFENCWFSPHMLETFMERSKDTSLHTLTLDSVSMLARHSSSTGTPNSPMTTIANDLKCEYPAEDWLDEQVPASATWFETLDKITPGETLLDRKYAAGMIDEEEQPKPQSLFRGHVQKIVLQSCGYAMIEGLSGTEFNQSNLVVQPPRVADAALRDRSTILRGSAYDGPDDPLPEAPNRPETRRRRMGRDAGSLMLRCPTDLSDSPRTCPSDWRGMGSLTQCIHPVEKRLLEQAWGMTFGWGDTLDRWAAVEDGFMEGGTGRFSGVINA